MTRNLKEFVSEHYHTMVTVRKFWNELLFKGEHRAPNAAIQDAIRHIYKRAGYKCPEVKISENPLANTINYMDLHARRKKEKRFLKRNEDTLVLSFVLQDMITRWNKKIKEAIADFRLFDTTKEKIKTGCGHPFTLDIYLSYYEADLSIRQLFPSRWNGLHSKIGAAAHTILCKSLLQEDSSPEEFQREYYRWTGVSNVSVPAFILRQNRHPWLLKAIWANHGAEINQLYNLLPIYDFFYLTGILQDEDFSCTRQLFSAGIASIEPFEDACLVSKLPVNVRMRRNKIHGDDIPAVIYDGGMQLYYTSDSHFPASWLLHPDSVDLPELSHLDERPRHPILFGLLGAERISNILGTEIVEHIRDHGQLFTLYKSMNYTGRLRAPLYFLKVQQGDSEAYDFRCLSPASVKKILAARLGIGEPGTLEQITVAESIRHFVKSPKFYNDRHYNPFQQPAF